MLSIMPATLTLTNPWDELESIDNDSGSPDFLTLAPSHLIVDQSTRWAHNNIMPKAMPSSSGGRQSHRHNPLSEEYAPTEVLKQKAAKKRKSAQGEAGEKDFVDSKASQKILKIGQSLVDDEELERQGQKPSAAFGLDSRFQKDNEFDRGTRGFDEDEDEEEAWGDEDEEIAEEIVCIYGLVLWLSRD